MVFLASVRRSLLVARPFLELFVRARSLPPISNPALIQAFFVDRRAQMDIDATVAARLPKTLDSVAGLSIHWPNSRFNVSSKHA